MKFKPFNKFLYSFLGVLSIAIILLGSCKKEYITNIAPLDPPVANAGNSFVIQLPTSAATLTGSGTTTNGHIVGYLWSLVSGPSVPVINSPSSAATVVNGMTSAGKYIFQFMVIDSAGLTGVDTTSVTVLAGPPATPVTLTLQPGNNNLNEINYAIIGPNNGSAHDIDLDAATWTSGGAPVYIRGAVRFDLSSIPAGATIISAKLSLYSNPTPINGDLVNANSGPNNSMFIRRILLPWDGNATTWQTQPTTTTVGQISIPHTALPTLDLVDVDVKTIVDAMRVFGNNGFMMMLQNETAFNIRQFCSSNHANTAKRPKLVVVYQ